MAILKRELTEEEIAQLERVARSRTEEVRVAERANIVLTAYRLRHPSDAVRVLQKDKHTIRMWADRFCDEGLAGLQDRRRCGAPPTYTPEQLAEVIQAALTDPKELGLPFGSWTLDRLTAYMHEQRQVPISRTHIGEVLRGEGLRWLTQESWYGKGEKLDPAFCEKRGRLSGHTPRPPRRASSSA